MTDITWDDRTESIICDTWPATQFELQLEVSGQTAFPLILDIEHIVYDQFINYISAMGKRVYDSLYS